MRDERYKLALFWRMMRYHHPVQTTFPKSRPCIKTMHISLFVHLFSFSTPSLSHVLENRQSQPSYCSGPVSGNSCDPTSDQDCCVNSTTIATCLGPGGCIMGEGGCTGPYTWDVELCDNECVWGEGSDGSDMWKCISDECITCGPMWKW
jgi:hypothetical protein